MNLGRLASKVRDLEKRVASLGEVQTAFSIVPEGVPGQGRYALQYDPVVIPEAQPLEILIGGKPRPIRPGTLSGTPPQGVPGTAGTPGTVAGTPGTLSGTPPGSLGTPDYTFRMTPSQSRFFFDDSPQVAFVSGYGSGKTAIGLHKLLRLVFEFPTIANLIVEPTYKLMRDIVYPGVEELCYRLGVECRVSRSEDLIYIADCAPILCRTADRPERIIGFEVGACWADELDTLPLDKGLDVYRKILGRMRQRYPDGRENQLFVTSTPEGYRTLYKVFKKDAIPGVHSLHHGSTYENAPNLPPNYIPMLESQYPEHLISAYLKGQFCSLADGVVYPAFDRDACATDVVAKPREPIHVGMDFNVCYAAAVIHVIRNGVSYAVDEIHNAYDTNEMIDYIRENYAQHAVTVYPDASGKNRASANTTETDLFLLKQAGFKIKVDNSNPPIKTRIQCANAAILNGSGARRYFVNVEKCPNLVEAREAQVYGANGLPDKTSGFDHINDAADYFVAKTYPIVARVPKVASIIQY